MVSKALDTSLRASQLICTVIVLSLIGNMIYTASAGNPAVVNYDVFAAVFALLSLLYLIPTTFLDRFNVHVVAIALDALNTLFWFCAAVATAAYLGVHSCSNDDYTRSNRITNGSSNTQSRCRKAQASTAFFFFGWAAFTLSLIFSVLSGRGNTNMRGGIRKGGPTMSKV